jgi:hypothetical protein
VPRPRAQSKAHAGRLTVVLDLDGTLLSSFTPRRAPALPPGSVSYIVGRGGRLNPNGVFVVERPGLKAFLHRLSEFAGARAARSAPFCSGSILHACLLHACPICHEGPAWAHPLAPCGCRRSCCAVSMHVA